MGLAVANSLFVFKAVTSPVLVVFMLACCYFPSFDNVLKVKLEKNP